jgi:DNA-binding NarL/FixJ family response regulator
MRCLIVDDHPMTRDGTAIALGAADPAMEIFQAGSLLKAFEMLAQLRSVDLVLLDLDLDDSHGVATLYAFKDWCEVHEVDARVVVLSGHCEPDLVREVVGHFATGFIQKATSQALFKHAIGLTLAGGVYIPEVALRQMGGPQNPALTSAMNTPPLALTPREVEVASLLVQGYTYKKIARELERTDGKPVSEHTIRAHVGNIAWKLGVTENAKAGVMAEIARRELRFPRPVQVS